MRRPISSPFSKALGNPIFPPFAKTPFGFVRPNSEGPIWLSPFLRNLYGRFSPTQDKGQTWTICERSFDFKNYFSLSNETPNFFSLFKALGTLYFLLSQKPLSDLFVQIPKVPSCFLHFWETCMVDFPHQDKGQTWTLCESHRFQKLFQSQQWDAQFLLPFQKL